MVGLIWPDITEDERKQCFTQLVGQAILCVDLGAYDVVEDQIMCIYALLHAEFNPSRDKTRTSDLSKGSSWPVGVFHKSQLWRRQSNQILSQCPIGTFQKAGQSGSEPAVQI